MLARSRSASHGGGVPARTFTAKSTRPGATSVSPWCFRSNRSADMGVSVSVSRVVGVVMRALGQADAVLEAGQRDPVDAGVAVHPDVTGQCLLVPLDHQLGQPVAVADHLAASDVEL